MTLTYGDIPGSTYGDAGSQGTAPDFGELDPELIVTGFLRADPTLAGLTAGVSTELPHDFPRPWVRVVLLPGSTQADGRHEDHRLHRYRLNVEAWADTKPDARATLNAAADAALALVGTHANGIVTSVELEGLPFWLPDPDDDIDRYITTLALYCHAPPTA